MAKISFEKLYKSIVEGFNESPPESVWQNIQDDLDIDDVWNQLDSKLPSATTNPSYSPLRQAVNYVLFFSLLFLFKSNSEQSISTIDILQHNNQETLLVEHSIKKSSDTVLRITEKAIETQEEKIADFSGENRGDILNKNSASSMVRKKPSIISTDE